MFFFENESVDMGQTVYNPEADPKFLDMPINIYDHTQDQTIPPQDLKSV